MKDEKIYRQINDKQAVLIFLLKAEIKIKKEIMELKQLIKIK